jgi:hypothetical protein
MGGYFPRSMNSPMKRVAAVLLIAFGAILAGCSTDAPADSSIPWNRPADWEGQIPGMSGSGSQVH